MKEIICLLVAPMQSPVVTILEASIDAFNRAVSLDAEEELHAAAKKIEKGIYVLYAPDAFLAGLDANRKVCGEILSGVFYVVAVDEKGCPISITGQQMLQYMDRFYEVERYDNSEILANWHECFLKELDDITV